MVGAGGGVERVRRARPQADFESCCHAKRLEGFP